MWTRRTLTVVRLTAATVMLIALTVLILHVWQLLTGPVGPNGRVNMKANTAICFLVAGAGIFLLKPKSAARRKATLIAGMFVAAIGFLTLLQDLTGLRFGIDELVLPDLDAADTGAPGRMAPSSALSFMLAGAMILCLAARRVVLAQITAFFLGAISLWVMAGYVFAVSEFYRIGIFTAMAPDSALSFAMLILAAIMLTWQQGALAYTREVSGFYLTVIVLPLAVFAIFGSGWLIAHGISGLVDESRLGIALLAVCSSLILIVLTLATGVVTARAERREKLHIREMRHRIANSFSVILSIVRLSSRKETDLSEFAAKLEKRILVLSEMFDELSDATRQRMPVSTLADRSLKPFRDCEDPQISCSGEEIELPARSAVGLSLVLHELATNAVKYGALSRPEGRVVITWSGEDGVDGKAALSLEWRESGGPATTAPDTTGFGSELISNALPGAETNFSFRQDGLLFTMVMPVPDPEMPEDDDEFSGAQVMLRRLMSRFQSRLNAETPPGNRTA